MPDLKEMNVAEAVWTLGGCHFHKDTRLGCAECEKRVSAMRALVAEGARRGLRCAGRCVSCDEHRDEIRYIASEVCPYDGSSQTMKREFATKEQFKSELLKGEPSKDQMKGIDHAAAFAAFCAKTAEDPEIDALVARAAEVLQKSQGDPDSPLMDLDSDLEDED